MTHSFPHVDPYQDGPDGADAKDVIGVTSPLWRPSR